MDNDLDIDGQQTTSNDVSEKTLSFRRSSGAVATTPHAGVRVSTSCVIKTVKNVLRSCFL